MAFQSRILQTLTLVSPARTLLVKIHTDEGTVGIGEACAWEPEFYGETLESVSSSIQKYLAPRIIGQDPLNINRITNKAKG
ncbi:hypothetical protein LCGC14_0652840 [marine sediment metagenome]|uniref:Mandelate racemase/muconate lactonizing enzyme N-terminal domain-containing protein n=1 Tax=marine sediment metagenome TaxID=412755 RepID=A0A0F9U486_9ZZZZ